MRKCKVQVGICLKSQPLPDSQRTVGACVNGVCACSLPAIYNRPLSICGSPFRRVRTLLGQTVRRSRVCGSTAYRHAKEKDDKKAERVVSVELVFLLSSISLYFILPNQTSYGRLTSAWEPDDRTFLHFSHLRHGRCQSLPSDVTFSAAKHRNPPPPQMSTFSTTKKNDD